MTAPSALTTRVLEFLIDRMHIDSMWLRREDDAMTWWASSLAQRIWAAGPRDIHGVGVTTLHIETDLLSGVEFDEATWQRLASVNQFATLSAYVADTLTASIRLHASVSLTDDNWMMGRALALHAMALQAADAHDEAAALAEAFGASIAKSAHPDAGARTTPDEMLSVMDVYQERGERESPFDDRDLSTLVHLEPRPWVRASNEHQHFDADLAFTRETTSRLEFDASTLHPALGSGLQIRLLLPVEPDAAIAQKLNGNERLEPDAHQLGAWCLDRDRGLMFVSFIPSAVYMPGLSRALAYHMSARNDWARALLFPTG